MAAALSLDHVEFRWPGGQAALSGVSGTVSEGTWLAVIGPNGAGKSTLLKVMAGWERPAAGTVRLWDRPLSTYRIRERARAIAVVPQRVGHPYDLTVRTVVSLGRISRHRWWDRVGRLGEEHAQAVESALALTGTRDLSERRMSQLSGGEEKRVLLAMALAQETPILLLDEPTAFLDPGHARDFLERVRLLVRDQAKTVVMAYHDLVTVGLYCDGIWAMDRGRVVLAGPSGSVLNHPELQRLYGLEFMRLTHPRHRRPMLLFP